MQIDEQPNTTQIVKDLWDQYYPSRATTPDNIAQAALNKDWIKDSLLFFGWQPGPEKLDINISFIDGGAVLYYNRVTPCALISLQWSDNVPSLRFTYADNRPQ